jgi:hypothetical protein
MAQLQVESPALAPGLARLAGLLAYAAGLCAWIAVVGLPKQTYLLIGWLWLATIAWNIRAPLRSHLAFARDWAPALGVLLVYLYSRGLADELGIIGVHLAWPAEVDRWLFGGTLPTEHLQAELCGVPCRRTMTPHWYDVVLTTVYYSHFFVALVTAVVLWLRSRTAWLRFMQRYLSLNILGLVVYITFPMAPPWMAAQSGVVSADVARITGRGWFDLSSAGSFHHRFSAVGNPVAAMPSLHAAIAMLVAAYGVSRLRSPWRWLLLLYPAAMSFMLVYYAEHYVVDVLAGLVAVVVVMGCWSLWERAGRRRDARVSATADPQPAAYAGPMAVNRSRRARYARRRKLRMDRVEHDLTDEQWAALVATWGGCAYCGATDRALQRDCVQPLSRGGRYTLTNIVPACGSCNASKCHDEVTGWLRRKRLDERAFLARHVEIQAALARRLPDEPGKPELADF